MPASRSASPASTLAGRSAAFSAAAPATPNLVAVAAAVAALRSAAPAPVNEVNCHHHHPAPGLRVAGVAAGMALGILLF